MGIRPWLYVAACDWRRDVRAVAGRLVLLLVAVSVFSAFTVALPAYRDSFAAPIGSARFDVDVEAAATAKTLTEVMGLPGVDQAAGVLGLLDVPITSPAGVSAVGAFGWALDSDAAGVMTPIGPQRVAAGTFDLGSQSAPRVVLDRELAANLAAKVGDRLTFTLGGQPLGAQVAAITGSAARYRGPSFAILRAAVAPLVPVDPDLKDYPYTEVLVSGNAPPEEILRHFDAKAIAYTKAEQVASMESQIEVSSPVIEVVSVLSAIALAAVLLVTGFLAVERRRELITLLPHLGGSRTQVGLAVLTTEALPAAAAVGVGTAVGILVIVNGYFGQVSAVADPSATVAVALALAMAVVLIDLVALMLRARGMR